MKTFIDEEQIAELLDGNKEPLPKQVAAVVKKAGGLKGLNPEETALLLQCEDKASVEEILKEAREVKKAIYGNRLVFFAPLYLSNICVNNCLYCGFRAANTGLRRRRLTMDEIKKEVEILENEGHKRLLLVAGEEPGTANIEYIVDAIRTVYETKTGRGAIRRVNVNVAPLNVPDFRRLKAAGIGTYQLFQETYHEESYRRMHPNGPKADYEWRLSTMDRVMEAGIDDVGIGALFGLYDYKFEVMSLLYHSRHLERKFGVGPHTISVPRVKPALNAPLARHIPHPVSKEDFKKLVAIIRLAVPYTGMILSTREPSSFRDEVFPLGISQISAGSRTNPGAYAEHVRHAPESEQFHLDDTRTQLEVVKDIVKKGFFPSFCTACYRLGRTGKDFMDLAKPGDIKDFCLPNCLLTYKEYLLDYGDEELKKDAEDIIKKEVRKIPDRSIRERTKDKLRLLEEGERDLYF